MVSILNLYYCELILCFNKFCPPIPLSIVTIRLPLVAWRVHPKGCAHHYPHSPQPAAFHSAGCIWHTLFNVPGGGPATQTLPRDLHPPGACTGLGITKAWARPCTTPRQGQVSSLDWSPSEDDFCIFGSLVFLIWGAAPFWYRQNHGHFFSSWGLFSGPFALAG